MVRSVVFHALNNIPNIPQSLIFVQRFGEFFFDALGFDPLFGKVGFQTLDLSLS